MPIIKNSIIKLLIITTLAFFAFFFASNAFAATITVDTVSLGYSLDGQCTLDEAIQNANDDAQTHGDCVAGFGIDTIDFNIGITNDTQVISDADQTFEVTSPIIFNGLTQGNASCGVLDDLSDRDLDIEIQGIRLNFQLGADGSSIRGLSILGGETYSAISTEDIDGFDLTCSNIGIDASGTSANATRDTLIRVDNSDNVTIGDVSLAIGDTNIFAGGNADPSSESIGLGEVNNFSAYGNWFGKGVGPSFKEFLATQDYVELCGPTSCGGGNPRSSNLVFEGNDLTVGGAENSFSLNGADILVLENNDFENSLEISIGIQDSTNVTVLENNISGGTNGIDIYDSSVSVNIESNNIENVGENGIMGANNSNFTLTDNTISGAGSNGVEISNSDTIAVLENNISGVGSSGVDISNSDNVVVLENNISSGQKSINLTGPSENITIQSNTLEGSADASILADEGITNLNILNNIVSNNTGSGLIVTANDVIITGNYIGTDETGTLSEPNGTVSNGQLNAGIVLLGSTNVTIGGDQPADWNIISGNNSENFFTAIGVFPDFNTFVFSENITIQGNYIGVAADGVTPLPNNEDGFGIYILGEDILVGGTNASEYNTIQGGFVGIGLVSLAAPSPLQDISILGNKIYNNSGNAIDLAADDNGDPFPESLIGPNPNDPLDTDEGPNAGVDARNNLNHLLNYPEFTSYETNTTTTDIEYILDVPAGDYRIEFFQNSTLTPYGEGETFLDFQNITHTGSGQETFTITLPVEVGDYIAATATERNQATTSTFGATSEFSASATIEAMAVVSSSRRSTSSSPQSRANAKAAFAQHYATTTSSDSSSNNSSNEDSNTCSSSQILTQNLKAPSRNGVYHSYTQAIVTEATILQAHLNRLGFNSGPEDSIIGPLTDGAIKRMQTFLGTIPDGYVGPITRGLLNESCGEGGLQS